MDQFRRVSKENRRCWCIESNEFTLADDGPIHPVSWHSQADSIFSRIYACETFGFSATSPVVPWRSESIMAYIWVSSTSIGHIVAHLSVKNYKNEIWQTNFHTAFLSRLHSHIRHITSSVLATRSCLLGNNTIKYVWNARLVLPFLNSDKNESEELIDVIFLLNYRWKCKQQENNIG